MTRRSTLKTCRPVGWLLNVATAWPRLGPATGNLSPRSCCPCCDLISLDSCSRAGVARTLDARPIDWPRYALPVKAITEHVAERGKRAADAGEFPDDDMPVYRAPSTLIGPPDAQLRTRLGPAGADAGLCAGCCRSPHLLPVGVGPLVDHLVTGPTVRTPGRPRRTGAALQSHSSRSTHQR